MYEARQNKEKVSRRISKREYKEGAKRADILKNNRGIPSVLAVIQCQARTYNICVRGRAPESNRALTEEEVRLHVVSYIGGNITRCEIYSVQNGAYYVVVTVTNLLIEDIRNNLRQVPASISCKVKAGKGDFPRT